MYQGLPKAKNNAVNAGIGSKAVFDLGQKRCVAQIGGEPH
jgi:hypothetical protein